MAEGKQNQPTCLLYHERQESRLCAVHCLNAVLQGPYFSEFELAAIARELDQSEQEMMREGGEQTASYLQFLSEGSSNVALDGNFSIQVLQKALSALDLVCVSWESEEAQNARANPQHENAFICNLQEHWFTLRKVNGEWYNFNSLFPAPEHLSGFYFSAFLDSLRNSGWSIFVVRGKLPLDFEVRNLDSSSGFGQWLTPEEAAVVAKAKGTEENREEVDPMLAAAISASLQDSSSSKNLDPDVSDLAAAIAASLADVRPP